MKALRSQNYYDILGVTPSASSEDIRKAYELSKLTYQENSLATYSLFTDEENQEIMGLISRAYETLFNPQLRREYDEFLESLRREGKSPSREEESLTPSNAPAMRRAEQFPERESAPPLLRQGRPAHGPVSRPAVPADSRQEPVNLGQGEQHDPAAESPAAKAPPPPTTEPPPMGNAENEEKVAKYVESVTVFDGQALKKVRELHGLTLEDVAERTKIRRAYLEYIEEEQFTFLPAEIYVKGFITMIAKMLDLPSDRVVGDYMQTFNKE